MTAKVVKLIDLDQLRLNAAKRQRKSRQRAKEKKAQIALDKVECDETWERTMLATLKAKYE